MDPQSRFNATGGFQQYDVICDDNWSAEGNLCFTHIIASHKILYAKATKANRIKIAQIVVNTVRLQNPPGRFLEQDAISRTFHDIGDARAVAFTRKIFRKALTKIRKANLESCGQKVVKLKRFSNEYSGDHSSCSKSNSNEVSENFQSMTMILDSPCELRSVTDPRLSLEGILDPQDLSYINVEEWESDMKALEEDEIQDC